MLGNVKEGTWEDTITMANVGYIQASYFQFNKRKQLKANAGMREFRIRKGRSSQVYEIDSISVSRGSVVNSNGTYHIPIVTYDGSTIFPLVCCS